MTTPVTMTRHRCDHCRRTWASRSRARAHEELDCLLNPAFRHCKTCAHWTGTIFGSCEVGAAPAWPYIQNANPEDDEPDYMQVANCDQWEAAS